MYLIIFSEQKLTHAYNLQISTRMSVGLFNVDAGADAQKKDRADT